MQLNDAGCNMSQSCFSMFPLIVVEATPAQINIIIICWILSNIYKLLLLVHLCDDILIISLPLITTSFQSHHSNPFSLTSGSFYLQKKNHCPSTSLEFHGITLDTNLLQASLPLENIDCITF